jgi:hypothetical protein
LFTSRAGKLNVDRAPSTMKAASMYIPASLAAVAYMSQPTR